MRRLLFIAVAALVIFVIASGSSSGFSIEKDHCETDFSNRVMRDYIESHLFFHDGTFGQQPEQLLQKKLTRYRISKLS